MTKTGATICFLAALVIKAWAQSTIDYDVMLAEFSDGDIIIGTNELTNYAVISNRFTNNWQAASVNGQEVLIADSDGRPIETTLTSLSSSQQQSLESNRQRFDSFFNSRNNGNINNNGIYNGQQLGQLDYRNDNPIGTIFYSRNNGISSQSIGRSRLSDISTNQYNDIDGISFSFNDRNNDFTVAKSDLPNNWSRIITLDRMLISVTRDGKIHVRSLSSLSDAEQQELKNLREDLKARAAKFQEELRQRLQKQQQELQERLQRQQADLQERLQRQQVELQQRLQRQNEELQARLQSQHEERQQQQQQQQHELQERLQQQRLQREQQQREFQERLQRQQVELQQRLQRQNEELQAGLQQQQQSWWSS